MMSEEGESDPTRPSAEIGCFRLEGQARPRGPAPKEGEGWKTALTATAIHMGLPCLLMPIVVCDNQSAPGINEPRARHRNDPQKTP
jgi:hypothetical protein